ncbi:MAG: DnaJ domain-containing protein [Anaerolineales bacterium]
MPTGNLYSLLGVPLNASPDDIKIAYRGSARRFHPDVNKTPGATDEFKLISEAHEILSDADKRAQYDARLKGQPSGSLLAVRALLSREKVPVLAEPQVVYALVDIRPNFPATDLPSPPVNLALVIDRSTSMQGERLDQVKAAVSQLIESLRENDVVSVVTFSDKAETVVAPQRGSAEQKTVAKAKVSTINAAGGTEMLRGLLRGMLELQTNLSPAAVNHLMLLTDGQTYGDETNCFLLAALAAIDGVSISGLGIGDEWNDKFLDDLASTTGGSSAFITSPEHVKRFLHEKVRGLGAALGERLALRVLCDQDVKLSAAFKLSPEPAALNVDEAPLRLGSLPKDQNIQLLLKFLLPPMTEGARPMARLALYGDIISLNRRNDRATRDLAITALSKFEPVAPPTPMVEALAKVTQYQLQEKAFQQAAAGDLPGATRTLSTLGTRLLASGQPELAKMAIAEAKRLERSSTLNEDAKKRLKYGTRALIMPAAGSGTLRA